MAAHREAVSKGELMASVEDKRRAALRGRRHCRDDFGRLLLTGQEARFLNCLLCNQGRIVTHQELVDWMWGDDPDGGPLDPNGIIKTRVCWLRFLGWPIETSWGRGYIIPWRDQARPDAKAPIDRRPAYRRKCLSVLVLEILKDNTHRWLNGREIGAEVYRRDPDQSSPDARSAVQVTIYGLRRRGWDIDTRRDARRGGYRLNPAVVGTVPDPRYSTTCGRRY
jgi:DNA-binding response OmpR family regulator